MRESGVVSGMLCFIEYPDCGEFAEGYMRDGRMFLQLY